MPCVEKLKELNFDRCFTLRGVCVCVSSFMKSIYDSLTLASVCLQPQKLVPVTPSKELAGAVAQVDLRLWHCNRSQFLSSQTLQIQMLAICCVGRSCTQCRLVAADYASCVQRPFVYFYLFWSFFGSNATFLSDRSLSNLVSLPSFRQSIVSSGIHLGNNFIIFLKLLPSVFMKKRECSCTQQSQRLMKQIEFYQ